MLLAEIYIIIGQTEWYLREKVTYFDVFLNMLTKMVFLLRLTVLSRTVFVWYAVVKRHLRR